MNTLVKCAVTAGLAIASLATVSPAAEAGTFTCALAPKMTHVSLGASQNFKATSDCEGVFATGTTQRADDIRGRYYKDGEWKISSLGWTRVNRGDDGVVDMVVGNTITGRDIKGQAKVVIQQVGYAY